MEKVSEIGIEKFKENVANGALVMYIRIETTDDGKSVNAPVKRGEKVVATLTSETDGSIFLSVNKDANLSAEEHADLFAKSASVMAEIRGIKQPE